LQAAQSTGSAIIESVRPQRFRQSSPAWGHHRAGCEEFRAGGTGEPSLFFRILLADASIRDDTIADLTRRIATALFDAIRPLENWGLRPYFNFRSQI
jgi:hypothetical protein